MASNDPFGNQNWGQQPPVPPRQGMSTGTKVLLILLAIFGSLALLCCGGGVGGFFFLQKYIAQSVSKDPQVVESVTRQIAEIRIPKGLEPQGSLDMKFPFTGKRIMAGVSYTDKSQKSTLLLGVFSFQANAANRDEMQRQMEQSFRQQGFNPHHQDAGRWQSQRYEKEVEIRGQKVVFQFTKRTNPDSKETRLDVVGTFSGDQGPVMLALSADTSEVSEEEAVRMLESIK